MSELPVPDSTHPEHLDVDSPAPIKRTDLKRCPDVWYNDGSAIILAETTLFRVYLGLLAQYSTVFRGMFEMPQPSHQEKYEGLPLIELRGDKAVDVHRFLLAVHNASIYNPGPSADMEFIDSVLRISIKYDVSHFRKHFVQSLEPYFPSTLEGFDEFMPLPQTEKYANAQMIRIINIAHEHELPILLPSALLFCCQLSFEDILDGIRIGESIVTLRPELQRVVILAREKISDRTRIQTYAYVRDEFVLHTDDEDDEEGEVATKCIRQGCRNFRKYMADMLLSSESRELSPIPKSSDSSLSAVLFNQTCNSCRAKQLTHERQERESFWSDLPGIFGLHDWETLVQESS